MRTTREWLERLMVPGVEHEEVDGRHLLTQFFDEAGRVGAVYDSSEYWMGVNWTLQGNDRAARGPEGYAYEGVHEAEPDGPVESYLEPEEVQATFAALSRIDEADFRRRSDVLRGNRAADASYESEMVECWSEFEDLRAFYARAAAAGECVLSMTA